MQITTERVWQWIADNDHQRYVNDRTWSFSDVASTYGEPGYQDERTKIVVLGNWWLRGEPTGTDKWGKLTHFEQRYPRLSERLAEAGVSLEWYDEWMVDSETQKAWRTEGDSYSWMRSVQVGDGDWLTPDHDIDDWLDWAKNDHQRCINDRQVEDLPSKLEALGWERIPPDHEFASGWYAGQNDDPKLISQRLRAEYGEDIDIVYQLTDVGQFDCHFVAWWIGKDEED